MRRELKLPDREPDYEIRAFFVGKKYWFKEMKAEYKRVDKSIVHYKLKLNDNNKLYIIAPHSQFELCETTQTAFETYLMETILLK